MDANAGSGRDGFDAALRALEDLESSVAQGRETKPAVAVAPAPAAEPVLPPTSVLAFSDSEEEEQDDQPVAIATAPLAEFEPGQPVPPLPLPAEPVATQRPSATPSAPAPAAAPVAAAPVPGSRAGLWTKVAIGLGLGSSVVSAAGLIIAERTIMSARLVVADARERQEQLAQAGRLIHDLELVRDRQLELLKAQQAQLANAPVTSAELQHRMNALQEGIMKRDPVNQVVQVIREGQSDSNARLNEFAVKMDRMEARIAGR
jgi:hypothetical protein